MELDRHAQYTKHQILPKIGSFIVVEVADVSSFDKSCGYVARASKSSCYSQNLIDYDLDKFHRIGDGSHNFDLHFSFSYKYRTIPASKVKAFIAKMQKAQA